MAECKVTTVAPGVIRTELGYACSFVGSKDALLSSGVVQHSWFSIGELDTRGRVIRHKDVIVDGRKVRTRSPAKGPWRVYMEYTNEESKAQGFKEALCAAAAGGPKELLHIRTVAAFKVGEVCRCYDYSDAFLAEVEIVGAYGIYNVGGPDEPGVHRFGYIVKSIGDSPAFCPAALLRERDGKIRHVCAVD